MVVRSGASRPGSAAHPGRAPAVVPRETRHVGRQCGDLLLGRLALHGQPAAVRRQVLAGQRGEVRQRGKGPRHHDVDRRQCEAARPAHARPAGCAAPVRAATWRTKEAFLATASTQQTVQFGRISGPHHARQAGAAAHVEDARRAALEVAVQRRQGRQAVEQMLMHHLLRVAHRAQVVGLVPLLQQVQIGKQVVCIARRPAATALPSRSARQRAAGPCPSQSIRKRRARRTDASGGARQFGPAGR